MDKDSDSSLLKPLPVESADSSTPKSGKKGSIKKDTPKPKKRINTLKEALERIEELELALKDEEWKKKDMKEKHIRKIAALKSEWAAKIKKLDDKLLEKNKQLRQKTNALKKDKAGFDEALAILGKSRRDLD